MTRFLLAFILLFCIISEGFSQKSLSEYSYVVVPEKFEFVNEVDKYQLNSLTRFLFNKHGFNAYFDRELPDVRRCDGLYAEVEGKPAMIRTKVTVILKDCYGTEVYRSEVGKSKIKAYNKTYTAALREAFLSIEALGVEQKDPVLFSEAERMVEEQEEFPVKTVVKIPVTTEVANPVSEEKVAKKIDETGQVTYTNNGATFILKSTNIGYSLYEQLQEGIAPKGTIKLDGAEPLKFQDAAGNVFPCHFDEAGNLIIETSFQKLLFTKVGQ
jgi:hypothetical protein